MAYSVLDGEDYDGFVRLREFWPEKTVKRWYWVDADVNGAGISAFYWGNGAGGGMSGNLLQIAPGNFITTDYEVQRYLDTCDIDRVKFLGELPL